MKVVLDTSAYILLDHGNALTIEILEHANELMMSTISLGELYYGFKKGTHFKSNFERLQKFIQTFGVLLIPVGVDIASVYGDLFLQQRKKGKPIGSNDLWIAASTLFVNGTLLTTDQDFKSVEKLKVEFV